MQRGFPDCEAKRRIGPERWQRVNIEFEFESRNLRQHRQSARGCDVIVCWRHNWEGCPKKIEVVELSRVIKSLAQSKGGEQRGSGQGLAYLFASISDGNLRKSLSKPGKSG